MRDEEAEPAGAATLLQFCCADNADLPGHVLCGMLARSVLIAEHSMSILFRVVIALIASCTGPVCAQSVAALAVSEIAPGDFVHYGSLEERSVANLGDNANIGF